jgi:hypothetical protein
MASRGSVSVDVRINQRSIDRFVQPGGEVYDWSWRVLLKARASARRRAPIGTGRLASSIEGEIDTDGPSRVTVTLGTDGVSYAADYLLGHAAQGPVKRRPIGAAQIRRGMSSGQVNRRPGRRYSGTPTLFTNGPIAGFEGNNILAAAMAEAYASEGLIVSPESFTWV